MMYPVEINKETFEERFGKKVLDIPKKDALIGATTIFLKESTWLEYEKEIETKIIQAQVMDDYAASERDDETASHYESEFEYPRDPNSMKMNQFGDVEQGKGSRSSKEQPKKKTTALRKRWLCCVWASTFCYFPICLSLCGRMKDRDRQIAWREKVTLCLLIFLMNALVLFFIIGIGLLLCFPKPQLSIGQVTTFNKLNAEAKVYMYGKFYAVEKIIKTHVDKTVREGQTAQYYENAVLGRDVSRMFPKLKFTSTYW